jgi:hypothetical protein
MITNSRVGLAKMVKGNAKQKSSFFIVFIQGPLIHRDFSKVHREVLSE